MFWLRHHEHKERKPLFAHTSETSTTSLKKSHTHVNKSPNGGWSAAQIVAGGTGHLVPTEFTGSLYDETLGQTLFTFDQVKGGGNANHNQPAVTCTHSESVKFGESLGPGETLPPGTSAEDDVTFTLTVTAIRLS
jgi:hypothetical protein